MSNGQMDNELISLLDDVDKDLTEGLGELKDVKIKEEEGPAPKIQVTSDFLKKVISGETGEYVDKLVYQLDRAINASLKDDRTLFRQKLIATYWNFLQNLVLKININSSAEKMTCIRYGIVDMNLLQPDQQKLIKSIPWSTGQQEYPFYYLDEWIRIVSQGRVKASLIDEVAAKKKGDSDVIRDKVDRKTDTRNASLNMLKSSADERTLIEKSLAGEINILLSHSPLLQYDNIPDIYNPQQKELMTRIADDLRKLKNADQSMMSALRELQNADAEINELKGRMGDGSSQVDSKMITDEFNSVRQMIKMCVGPRGNHFPILISDYAPHGMDEINTKDNMIKIIREVEKRDVGVFDREFKQQVNKIVPYIIIVPAYGEKGICWEPFDVAQRATSRGRLAIPLYTKSPLLALLYAVGDLRWQVAKEKAAYRWMEEGLTGKYYEYFSGNKLKGNIKEEFVKDYIIWIMQEWGGTQKLHRTVREIFWRHLPFPQAKKDELRNRGFFYDDLYKKDMRRAQSDGY
ncbi:MAG: hypothetical protein PHF84_03680 [bacterium]|nr:hypothetical protein [bacterium]